jgi:hypothetical protein
VNDRGRSIVNDATVRRLLELDQEYTAAVNCAIAEDRDDLIDVLVGEYPDAAARIMTEDAA